MTDSVEELETELQEVLNNIDFIASQVQNKELDAYEGFVKSEQYKNRVVEIGNKLKAVGIDITTRTE